MTVIPLLSPAGHPDAWHQVTAPGGYERWYFDAEDSTNNLRFVVSFFDGYFFHPAYLRSYARYRRRPTRVAPPLPADYRCTYFALYREDRIIAQSLTRSPVNQFFAAVDHPEVRIGSNQFVGQEDGSFQIRLRAVPFEIGSLGATISKSRQVSATLSFKPKTSAPVGQLSLLPNHMHIWSMSASTFDVTASIDIFDSATPRTPETIHFSGRGYHDHHHGTRLLADEFEFWFWGRVILEDRLVAFNIVRPAGSTADVISLVDSDGMIRKSIEAKPVRLNMNARAGFAVRFPNHVELANDILLKQPRIAAASPFHLRLVYQATVGGTNAEAFCEIAYPGRLKWPILGRLIERAISSK